MSKTLKDYHFTDEQVDSIVRRNVAQNPNTPPEELSKFMDSKYQDPYSFFDTFIKIIYRIVNIIDEYLPLIALIFSCISFFLGIVSVCMTP